MKRWIDLLPAPFNRNPEVVVINGPKGAVSKTISTRERYELGVLEYEDKLAGLQVIHPQLATYAAHEDVFRTNSIPMAPPSYIGELLTLPQNILLDEERVPLVFIRDAMYRPYLNLRGYAARLTKRKGVDVS